MNDLDAIKSSQSASFKKRNPHIFGKGAHSLVQDGGEDDAEHDHIEALTTKQKSAKKRIRQSDKPVLNKLESEYQRILLISTPDAVAQAVRFKLGTGCHYTPDFFSLATMTAFEVKGKYAWEDSKLKIRMAAKVWTSIKWVLVWKEDGKWLSQIVIP